MAGTRLTVAPGTRSMPLPHVSSPGNWPPRRPAPPDPFAELRELWDNLRFRFGRGGGGNGSSAPRRRVNPYLLAWAATGVYIVAPDERGVVLRFGRVVRQTDPGPHYRLPWPIEHVLRP